MSTASPSSPVADAVASAQSLADLIRATARTTPDAPAVVGDGRSVTHGELDRRSSALAAGLVAAGLRPGDRVAYLARNATEYWELFFASAKAGVVIVPLNFRLAAPEVEWVLGDAAPAALVVEENLVPPSFTGLTLVIGESYEEFLTAAPAADPHRDSTGDDLFCLMYSSGTTGRPKGVTTTAGAFLWAVGAFGPQFDVSPASVSLVPTPYYHIAAGGWSLIALAVGGRIVQFTEVTPAGLIAAIVAHRATHVILVPTVMQLFISSPEASAADYSSVEWVVYGGSPISEAVMVGAQRVFGAKLAQSYGLTETIGVTTILGADDHVVGSRTLRSAGRAVPGVEVAVVDPATGLDVPAGTTGEVVTRGPAVTRGYWGRTGDDAYWPGGWFRTGDAGYLDDAGYLYLKDRIKDMISSGGENVYPAEVENAIMAHPDVLETAVIGVPSQRWGETPLAVVVLRPGASVAPEEIIAHCRERLAHYKCPTAVDIVADLPRNPSGKLLKRELRAPYWAGRERAIS